LGATSDFPVLRSLYAIFAFAKLKVRLEGTGGNISFKPLGSSDVQALMLDISLTTLQSTFLKTELG
jgi:hypothetical protein